MNGRLLIVDDEVAHMRALCSTLEMEGYETVGYESGVQALAELRPGAHELLLTDLLMPGIDGIGLMRAARGIDPDLAGVIMTGHGTIDTAVAAIQLGAFDYIQKPFRLNAILPIIARALDARRLRIENTALQQRERRQTLELASAYRDLESFAYSVSHDLRAPLRAVDGFCRMFVADYGATLPAEGMHLLEQVLAGTSRMERLIQDLLRFSRYSSQPLQRTDVDLGTLTRHVVAELRERNPAAAAAVVIGDLPPCSGDPSLIEQVLINLLSNAFKFTRNRTGARIEVGCSEQPAAADADDQRPERVYFVRDNGAGFDPAYAHRLFGVFQRLHTEQQFEGTGVGLSIVQRIVQRHGGRVWATGALDQGATFNFTLPGPP